MDSSRIIRDLPPTLQTDVMYELCAKHIRRVRLFSNCTEMLLRHMVAQFFVEILPCNQIIYQVGDIGHAMYFLTRGRVELLRKTNVVVRALESCHWFAVVHSHLSPSTLRSATLRCVALCRLSIAEC